MVQTARFELARAIAHYPLKIARIPVSPCLQVLIVYQIIAEK